jgi:hypothetical protein
MKCWCYGACQAQNLKWWFSHNLFHSAGTWIGNPKVCKSMLWTLCRRISSAYYTFPCSLNFSSSYSTWRVSMPPHLVNKQLVSHALKRHRTEQRKRIKRKNRNPPPLSWSNRSHDLLGKTACVTYALTFAAPIAAKSFCMCTTKLGMHELWEVQSPNPNPNFRAIWTLKWPCIYLVWLPDLSSSKKYAF